MPGDTLGSQSHKKHQAIGVCWDLMSTDQHMAQRVVLGAVVSPNAPVSSVICATQLQDEMGFLKCLTLLQIKLDSLGAQEPCPERVWTEAKPGTALSPVFIEWLISQHIFCRAATDCAGKTQ